MHDKDRYQTVYSEQEGAVAAPTAGLHFTTSILDKLVKCGIKTNYLTLHVGAGTFQPIKVTDPTLHTMHSEHIVVRKDHIFNLLHDKDKVIAVGTTAMRTLESLYWYGVKLNKSDTNNFLIEQFMPYEFHDSDLPSKTEALRTVLAYMDQNDIQEISGQTQLFILPGYRFRICQGLITNYHLPGSTLILLIAAFIGSDWRKVYHEALKNSYRFLSYGDASLLIPSESI